MSINHYVFLDILYIGLTSERKRKTRAMQRSPVNNLVTMAVKRYILITGGVAQDISFGPAYLRSFAIGDFKNAIRAPMFVSKIRNSPGNHCYYTNLFHNQKCKIITPSIKGLRYFPINAFAIAQAHTRPFVRGHRIQTVINQVCKIL